MSAHTGRHRDVAERARRQAEDSHGHAVSPRHAAERAEMRHRSEHDGAHRRLEAVEDRYAVAVETITRLQTELDSTRSRLDEASTSARTGAWPGLTMCKPSSMPPWMPARQLGMRKRCRQTKSSSLLSNVAAHR
ncbi:hypothetical protein ACIP5U_08580 [Streptomyces sp. NPDC088788]|uniref:hypothetical protein n=1 Tax=Streptomyces sp. NPDC088788 TaxID=3365898 RepID=UPI00382A5BF1